MVRVGGVLERYVNTDVMKFSSLMTTAQLDVGGRGDINIPQVQSPS